MAKKKEPKKESPKKYQPRVGKPPPRAPVPQHPHQCMWGCGSSFGTLSAARGHESGCSRNPDN